MQKARGEQQVPRVFFFSHETPGKVWPGVFWCCTVAKRDLNNKTQTQLFNANQQVGRLQTGLIGLN